MSYSEKFFNSTENLIETIYEDQQVFYRFFERSEDEVSKSVYHEAADEIGIIREELKELKAVPFPMVHHQVRLREISVKLAPYIILANSIRRSEQ